MMNTLFHSSVGQWKRELCDGVSESKGYSLLKAVIWQCSLPEAEVLLALHTDFVNLYFSAIAKII